MTTTINRAWRERVWDISKASKDVVRFVLPALSYISRWAASKGPQIGQTESNNDGMRELYFFFVGRKCNVDDLLVVSLMGTCFLMIFVYIYIDIFILHAGRIWFGSWEWIPVAFWILYVLDCFSCEIADFMVVSPSISESGNFVRCWYLLRTEMLVLGRIVLVHLYLSEYGIWSFNDLNIQIWEIFNHH